MEPRRSEREGSVRAPEIVSWLVHGWIGTPVPTARIAAASEQRVRPPLPLRQFEAQDTPRSWRPAGGRVLTLAPAPEFFLSREISW